LLKLNTTEQGHLVDDFLVKGMNCKAFYESIAVCLVGQICGDSPGITPTLIKNGIVPAVIESFKVRMPMVNLGGVEDYIYILSQLSIHEEGKTLISQCGLFKQVISVFVDPSMMKHLPTF
jgi:hypothetical protein